MSDHSNRPRPDVNLDLIVRLRELGAVRVRVAADALEVEFSAPAALPGPRSPAEVQAMAARGLPEAPREDLEELLFYSSGGR